MKKDPFDELEKIIEECEDEQIFALPFQDDLFRISDIDKPFDESKVKEKKKS